MKRKIAAAGTLMALTATASAQSSVTLFGVLDAAASRYTAASSFYDNTGRQVLRLPFRPPE